MPVLRRCVLLIAIVVALLFAAAAAASPVFRVDHVAEPTPATGRPHP